MSDPRYTVWHVFKVRAGRWTGRWCASNYSRADGFSYEQKRFDSHREALDYAVERAFR